MALDPTVSPSSIAVAVLSMSPLYLRRSLRASSAETASPIMIVSSATASCSLGVGACISVRWRKREMCSSVFVHSTVLIEAGITCLQIA